MKSGAGAATAVQTARIGGRSPNGPPGGQRGGQGATRARVTEVGWQALGHPAPAPDTGAADGSPVTDLSLVVDALADAARAAGVPEQPSPWLEPLTDLVVAPGLPGLPSGTPPTGAAVPTTAPPHRPGASSPDGDGDGDGTAPYRTGMSFPGGDGAAPYRAGHEEVPPLAFGVTDLPWAQDRRALTLDLAHGGHLLLAGTARSGRSTALRTLAGAIAAGASSGRAPARDRLRVGGPPAAGDHGALRRRRDARPARPGGAPAGPAQGRGGAAPAAAGGGRIRVPDRAARLPGEPRLPWLVLMLDRWEGFVSAFEGYDYGRLIDSMLQLLREGPAVGLRAVVTGDRSTLIGQISTIFDDRLILRMADPSEYGLAGLPARDLPTVLVPGRALSMGEHGLTESQIGLLDEDPSGPAQVAMLQSLARTVPARFPGTAAGDGPAGQHGEDLRAANGETVGASRPEIRRDRTPPESAAGRASEPGETGRSRGSAGEVVGWIWAGSLRCAWTRCRCGSPLPRPRT
nr:hypothetical protein GCM10020093_091330 [Planobispora longispora]